jgi:hypothetical protein
MAIRVTPAASVSRTQEYLHTKDTVEAIKNPGFDASECCFCVPNCDWDWPVFALLADDTDHLKNDRSTFIFDIPSGGSITAKLIQLNPDNSVLKETTIVDNTLGQLLPTGNVRANTWAFLLDWYKVANVEGFGRFKFNVTIDNSASTEIFNDYSVCYDLKPWTCANAHRTIKIQTEQSGSFEGGFDYSGLNWIFTEPTDSIFLSGTTKTTWLQEVRLYGVFYRESFGQERDTLATADRGRQLVQSKIWNTYKLKLDTIPTKLSNYVIFDMLQAPEVYITDHNISNIDTYNRVRVNTQEIGDPVNFRLNKNEFIEITLEDWQQDNVHRFK